MACIDLFIENIDFDEAEDEEDSDDSDEVADISHQSVYFHRLSSFDFDEGT